MSEKIFKINEEVLLAKLVSKDRLLERHGEICDSLKDLRKRKGNDYGSVFEDTFADYGLLAPIVRFRDKLGRIESLMTKKQLVADESIKDTILDLANYCILTASVIDCIEEYKHKEATQAEVNVSYECKVKTIETDTGGEIYKIS